MKKTYQYTTGILMIAIGFIALVLVLLLGGSYFYDFISGCLCGLGISLIVIGIVLAIQGLRKE